MRYERPQGATIDGRYLDDRYAVAHPGWHEEDAAWKARIVATLLGDHGLAPKRVAEVGCGTGGVLANLQSRLPADADLVGYELAAHAYDVAHSRARERLRFVNGDVFESRERFDLMLAIDVFEHVDDYLAFLRALRRHASWFVFHIPLDLSCYSLFREKNSVLQSRRRSGHIHYFTKALALECLAETGFEVVDARYSLPLGEHPPDLPRVELRSREGQLVRLLGRILYRFDADSAVRICGGSPLLVLARST